MSSFDFKFTSRREEYVGEMERRRLAALEAVGSQVAGYAGALAPVDTGRLKNSITWVTVATEGRQHTYMDDNGVKYTETLGSGVPDDAVVVGTNVEYAAYQEAGTSKTEPRPFLYPAVVNHIDEYRRMMRAFLSGEQ